MSAVFDSRFWWTLVAGILCAASIVKAAWVPFVRPVEVSEASVEVTESESVDWSDLQEEAWKSKADDNSHLALSQGYVELLSLGSFLGRSKKSDTETSTRSPSSIHGTGFECPFSGDTFVRATCPTTDRRGRYRCIDASMLCNSQIECPNGEDEEPTMCMFYKLTLHYIGRYGQSITRWVLPA